MLMIIEPFYGGSHKQMIDIFTKDIDPEKYRLVHMKAKKWHWRARSSALWISQNIPLNCEKFSTIFCSSVLNLCELLALRPDLGTKRKVIYFHENQLIYPVQHTKHGDFQYGYNQILSALVADEALFNSEYNMKSFLTNIPGHFKLQPDYKPDVGEIVMKIQSKSSVLYFPLYDELKTLDKFESQKKEGPLRIVWPHRWEHDKNPDSFFDVMSKLSEEGLDFRLNVLGESYSECPPIMEQAKTSLARHIDSFGFAESKSRYYEILCESDVVVSTANHEFFGVSMLEATYLGSYPLVPNRLVYPEIYPQECIYNTDNQLFNRLKKFVLDPSLVRDHEVFINYEQYTSENFHRALF